MEPDDELAAGYHEEVEDHASQLWAITNDLFIGANGLPSVLSLTQTEVGNSPLCVLTTHLIPGGK